MKHSIYNISNSDWHRASPQEGLALIAIEKAATVHHAKCSDLRTWFYIHSHRWLGYILYKFPQRSILLCLFSWLCARYLFWCFFCSEPFKPILAVPTNGFRIFFTLLLLKRVHGFWKKNFQKGFRCVHCWDICLWRQDCTFSVDTILASFSLWIWMCPEVYSNLSFTSKLDLKKAQRSVIAPASP